MPSVFPVLLSYEMSAPLLFRVVSGLLFIYFGYVNIAENRAEKIAAAEQFKLKPGAVWLSGFSIIEMAGGILLLLGFLTQAVSLILSIILLLGIIAKREKPIFISLSSGFLFLLLVITVSLLFLGPGFYSIDLPF